MSHKCKCRDAAEKNDVEISNLKERIAALEGENRGLIWRVNFFTHANKNLERQLVLVKCCLQNLADGLLRLASAENLSDSGHFGDELKARAAFAAQLFLTIDPPVESNGEKNDR